MSKLTGDVSPAGSLPPVEDTVEDEQVVVEEETPQAEEPVEEAPKLYAGKYESPEDLEQSYTSLSSKLGEQGQELGTLKAQNELLMRQLQEKQATPEKPVKEEPQTDYDQLLAEVGKAAEDGSIGMDEALLKVADITRQRTEALAEAKTAAMFDKAVNTFNEKLSERDQQVVIDKFNEDNPEYAQWQQDGSLQEIMASNPLHDELSAYYAKKAQVAAEEAQANFEKGKAEAARLKQGSEPVKKVLSKPGQSIQTANTPKQKLSKGELRKSMLAAIGVDK